MSTKTVELLDKQYNLAINARDKLNDNYHKWMTFYYVANGALVVAITSIFKDCQNNSGIMGLSIMGVIVCIFWNLSCRGYYYWSLSWINIIIDLERKLIQNNHELGVYSVFSERVSEKEEDYSRSLIAPANISTPKLTILISLLSTISWLIYLGYELFLKLPFSWYFKALILCLCLALVLVLYFIVIPKKLKSKLKDTHTLI
jgi:hypothetical protein